MKNTKLVAVVATGLGLALTVSACGSATSPGASGTPAASMDDPTPRAEKNQRFDRLCALQNRISEEKHRAYIGKTLRVLVDGRDGDKLTAGGGGPEIILPEAFYEYVAGALLTGVFASTAINSLSEGANIGAQALGLVWTILWSAVGTLIILLICKYTTGLRVTDEQESEGLDAHLHGEVLDGV